MQQTEQKPLTDIQKNVLRILQTHTNSVTRHHLQMSIFASASPNCDRRIRRAIEELRQRGYVIISSSQGSGYQLTTDPEKVRHYINEQVKRARVLLRTANKVKQAYGLRGQLPLSN